MSAQEIEQLLVRAETGDESAVERLMAAHRERLKKLVRVRLDRRMSVRADSSDVVQEALVDAARRLPEYLRSRDLPFYPWIRQLTLDRLARLRRTHLGAAKRDVSKEEPTPFEWNDDSVQALAERLVATNTSPSMQAMQAELRTLTRKALTSLTQSDQDVLVMKYLEHLTLREIASTLGLSEAAVKSRHIRALARFSQIMKQLGVEP